MFNKVEYSSKLSSNHFGNNLVATADLDLGAIVERFIVEPNAKPFNGDPNAPLDEKHVIVIGEKNGEYEYGRVISNAKYINHSCNPNCKVNKEKEVISIRPISIGEELTIKYDAGSGRWDPIWNFQCFCQAQNCRGRIDSFQN